MLVIVTVMFSALFLSYAMPKIGESSKYYLDKNSIYVETYGSALKNESYGQKDLNKYYKYQGGIEYEEDWSGSDFVMLDDMNMVK